MSVRLVANTLDYVHGIPHGAKLVLICMADYADDKGKCWPSFQKLSERCDMSRRHVIRVVADLEEMGFVHKIEERPYKPTIYGLTIPTSDTHVTSKKKELVTPTSLVTPETLVTPMSLGSDTHVTTTSDIAMSPKPPINHQEPPQRPARVSGQPPDDFMRVWAEYPNRANRKRSLEVWKKLRPNGELVEEMLIAISRQKQTRQWREGIVPHFSTWLNQERWTDGGIDVPVTPTRSGVPA